MFRKLSFTECCRSDVFQEVTLELKVTDEVSTSLKKETLHLQIANYKP
ncbi:hypothetical protein NP493_101g08020 [Ridgeia piscesae]|uniref:Uncharacterized protein n=1 Tax=Ridgeia piscesae TaxID=27915 RepID=A0AAD9P7K4_RIDPI|nr:hypothetical protein NP493_101g08020 [Ridgeia piscesae]